MSKIHTLGVLTLGTCVLAGCSSDSPTGPGGGSGECADISLSAGQSTVIDPATSAGCLRIPAAGRVGAEYLVVALSASAAVRDGGTTGPYRLTAGAPGAAVADVAPSPKLAAFRPHQPAAEFHQLLREEEQELARSPAAQFRIGAAVAASGPPVVGSQRTFNVIATTSSPFTFAQVTATAKYVGRKVAIYLDVRVGRRDQCV